MFKVFISNINDDEKRKFSAFLLRLLSGTDFLPDFSQAITFSDHVKHKLVTKPLPHCVESKEKFHV
ncbi:CLUMA_CG003522, isoform A [Clunio marinus]|uniref:CLUMA_CG003522, isoform A n=1 Tax=Clunio marinus TaxID=568069 RepID=A0A1J1HNS3_9DIPT|nr:CLUMA_CG003522, isoform A [Clunio marinus]